MPLEYVSAQVAVIRDREGDVRTDRPDAVHRTRVATRRLRACLSTYRSFFDAETVVKLREELKWYGMLLGAARDSEVLRMKLDSMLAAEPEELVMGPVSRRIALQLQQEHSAALDALKEGLDSERYSKLKDSLESFVADPALEDPALEHAAEVLPGLLQRDYKRLRKGVERAEASKGTLQHPLDLHEARKRAKRLRYAAESARKASKRAGLSKKTAKRVRGAAKTIQEILGEHQDSVVSRDWLRRIGGQAVLDGENGFSYGRLHALEQAAAEKAEISFTVAWARFRRPRRTSWLG